MAWCQAEAKPMSNATMKEGGLGRKMAGGGGQMGGGKKIWILGGVPEKKGKMGRG